MDFNDTSTEAAFRSAARTWLAGHAPAHALDPGRHYDDADLVARGRAWQKEKANGGYAAVLWPKEIGGRGGTPIEAVIFGDEEARFRLPLGPFASIGMSMAIPAIMRHGTPEQTARFAGPTLRGEMTWCQLFSEPAAGSDLAGVRTRAVRDGDAWIVNGQKVWSSWAHEADWGILLARTDPAVVKHKGLTFFLVDLKSAGIDVRPIRQISGKSDFNETFLTDVVVSDDCRVGAEGEGWACAMTVLMSERVSSGGDESGIIETLIARARDTPRGAGSVLDDGAARERLARWFAQEQGQKYFRYRLLTQLSKGQTPGAEAALIKLVYASRLQQSAGYAMEMQGYAGAVAMPGDYVQATIHEDYIWSSAMRVAGGADEVLLNQIAERVLDMPSDVRADKNTPFNQL